MIWIGFDLGVDLFDENIYILESVVSAVRYFGS